MLVIYLKKHISCFFVFEQHMSFFLYGCGAIFLTSLIEATPPIRKGVIKSKVKMNCIIVERTSVRSTTLTYNDYFTFVNLTP